MYQRADSRIDSLIFLAGFVWVRKEELFMAGGLGRRSALRWKDSFLHGRGPEAQSQKRLRCHLRRLKRGVAAPTHRASPSGRRWPLAASFTMAGIIPVISPRTASSPDFSFHTTAAFRPNSAP